LDELKRLHTDAVKDFDRVLKNMEALADDQRLVRLEKLKRRPPCTSLLVELKAKKYAYIEFDYLTECYTEPMTPSEFNKVIISIATTSSKPDDVGASNRLRKHAHLGNPRRPLTSADKAEHESANQAEEEALVRLIGLPTPTKAAVRAKLAYLATLSDSLSFPKSQLGLWKGLSE
jgi:hypothetical protein